MVVDPNFEAGLDFSISKIECYRRRSSLGLTINWWPKLVGLRWPEQFS